LSSENIIFSSIYYLNFYIFSTTVEKIKWELRIESMILRLSSKRHKRIRQLRSIDVY